MFPNCSFEGMEVRSSGEDSWHAAASNRMEAALYQKKGAGTCPGVAGYSRRDLRREELCKERRGIGI